MMQEDIHLFQGLRRDNHQIRQDSKFLWDAHNIRLTSREDSTLLSLTNEKGTSDELITFNGFYVGHCVLGKYLVVFTANDDSSDNYIYRVEKTSSGYKTIILFYESDIWENGWNPEHPIEAIGVYETQFIQKVYWVDGVNQPRVINIAQPEYRLNGTEYEFILELNNWDYSNSALSPEGNGQTFNQWAISGDSSKDWEKILSDFKEKFPSMYKKESLNFTQEMSLKETVDVYRSEGTGIFSPGTIQYAFSYYNKYGQETNIFYVTSIYYTSPIDRGGSPEESVANTFNIEIQGVDSFDFIRVYSIHRTSIDAVPTVKIVEDIPVSLMNSSEVITCTDDGTKGYTIDPTQLLYIGGRNIIAGTIAQKDNTLFLGNVTINEQSEKFADIANSDLEFDDWELPGVVTNTNTGSTYYDYVNPLSQGNMAGFKSNETYRCGVQVQTKDGIWSSPIFIADKVLCSKHPMEGNSRESQAIKFLDVSSLRKAGIKRIRTCIVFPKTYEREIICQGVLCPTVFSVAGRTTDSPYSQSSWFFRPATDATQINNSEDVYHGASIQFQHNKPLFTGSDRGAEIQNMNSDLSVTKVNDITSDNSNSFKSHYFVDENIVTFHSPDIEFDTQLQNIDWSNTRLNIFGMAMLDAISGDIDIQTSTPVAYSKGSSSGFNHNPVGYQTRNQKFINGGLVSGLFYESGVLNESYNISTGKYFMVYPWHRSGSLNNDSNRPDDKTRTAVLSKKKISNLKFFSKNQSLGQIFLYDISTPQMFNSNEISLTKIIPSYLNKDIPYMGNVDSMVTNGKDYSFYIGTSFQDENINTVGDDNLIDSSSDPVRMKYKSTPHLVFSLTGNNSKEILLLPRHRSIGGTLSGSYTFPDWQNTGSSDGSNDDKGLYDGDFSHIDTGVFVGYELTQYNLGKYAYDRLFGSSSGNYSIGLCRKDVNGKLYWDYSGHEGKIIRVVKDYTISRRKHGYYPPGISSKDFRNNLYISETKYYKVVAKANSNYYDLEEVSVSQTDLSKARESVQYTLRQESFGEQDSRCSPYLLLAELVRTVPDSIKFGGTSDSAKQQNLWFPAGRPVSISDEDTEVIVPFEYGDTWYSRYDCLKTYPFTTEDENQVVEIGSFLCETRINIDGRYDKNRGQISNLNMSPQNFNLLNDVYSQKDNFFNYRMLDKDYYKQNVFSNQITWSKEKTSGEEIDTWTNITLANTLDMSGEKGQITALKTWNEYILCFQDKALSQVLFNSRVQVPSSDGVPIEISNGYKVDGSRLLSNSIGCNNKWSIANTPMGVYFLDSNTNGLYLFNGQLTNLSEDRGMNWWIRQNHIDKTWMPISYNYGEPNGIRTFYDNKYRDVYFTLGPTDSINQSGHDNTLCYSEQLGQFTSLMSYDGTQAMFNFADGFFSLRETDGRVRLYENNVGPYNNFYGETKGWGFSFISNQNPTLTKIFDTIELRTDHYKTYKLTEPELLNTCPMNYIKVGNEYQNSGTVYDINMRKKFRVWRGLLPRNKGTRDRIRNLWSMITLGWSPNTKESENPEEQLDNETRKVVIHDVSVKYTI